MPVDAVSLDEMLARIGEWAARRESRVVCLCNVHSVVTAASDPMHRTALGGADLALADGAPVAWALRRLGFRNQARITGSDVMEGCCRQAERDQSPVFLYGSTPETLARLRSRLEATMPRLQIAGDRAPPFRDLTREEDEAVVRRVNDSGATVVFVGLGCPKQEAWMAAHRGRIRAVMIGVGAAFDFRAGTVKRAPAWAQSAGLEWLHRLVSEPRRVWKRYLVTNTVFILRFCAQLARHWLLHGAR